MPKFVLIEWVPFALTLLEKQGIDPDMVRRMVIDLEAGQPGKLYLEMYGDSDALGDPALAAGIGVEPVS